MKRRVKKVYKKLPPHTNEAHPFTNSGEASKPLIIGIIAIVAIIALSLLLLFSDQFVGKAYSGVLNSAGADLNSAKAYTNQQFSFNVSANIGTSKSTKSIAFELQLPTGIICSQVTITSLLAGWTNYVSNPCNSGSNKISFYHSTTDQGLFKTGIIDVAKITVSSPAKKEDGYVFDLESFAVFDSQSSINLINQINDITVNVIDPVCGDGDKAPAEQCDDGNEDDTDSCIQCQPASCGDGFVQTDVEQCDGSDLAGKTCVSEGFIDGTLSCNSCMLVTSMCVVAPTCADSTKNGQETDVDCGPGCPNCANDKICSTNDDCMSNYCDGGVCKNAPAPVCDANSPSLCTTQGLCLEFNNYWYNNVCYDACPSGTEDPDSNKVCTAEMSDTDVCDETHPSLCMTQSACTTAMNFWYNNACYDSCPSGTEDPNSDKICTAVSSEVCDDAHPSLCMTQSACTTAMNFWYNNACYDSCPTGTEDPNSDKVCTSSLPPDSDTLETPEPTGVTTQGIKIILTDILPANDIFATKITATETFTEEVTVYTVLYDENDKVLALKSEKVAGLVEGETYTAITNYPEINIKRKSVIVYDVKPGIEVSGNLDVELS